MKIATLGLSAALLFSAMSGFAYTSGSPAYGPLTDQAAAAFDAQVNQAIARAEANVQTQKTGATRHDLSPMWNSKLELQNAVIQLEVKKTLVGNFRGTESLESPVVRNMLLAVLNKSIITTADLADLQSVVLEEKAKIREAKAKAAADKAEQQSLPQAAPQQAPVLTPPSTTTELRKQS